MKKILLALTALSFGAAFAQDFGFGDMGNTGFPASDSFEDSSSAATNLSISGETGASVRAWGGSVNKDNEFDTRYYGSAYDLSKSEVEGSAWANLDITYTGEYTDTSVKIKLDESTLKEHPEDVIDELYTSGSFKDGRFQLKAGKMKEVWGKGDKVHVLDNFNANDYTDFIFPDYIDRRIGEIMFKATANISWDKNIKLEGIYTPMMTADRFATEGHLVPYAQKKLTDTVSGIVAAQAATALGSMMTVSTSNNVEVDPEAIGLISRLADFSQDDLFDDKLSTLKYGQAGLRLTGTAAGFDWGASYYYGHYKQPSANLNGTIVYEASRQVPMVASMVPPSVALADALPSLNYDQLQVFGLEAAFVLWKLNTRWEAAYNLTEDIAGDNPWVKNNSLAWVAGFDIDLPIHNLNLNVQETGTYTLKSDKIKDGGFNLAGMTIPWALIGSNYDVDYNSDDKYTRNKLIVLLSDKWLNEKLTTEIQGIYGFECKEFMIAPKVEYNVSEGLTLGARGIYLYSDNENGEFYNFTQDTKNHDKALLELTAKYQF